MTNLNAVPPGRGLALLACLAALGACSLNTKPEQPALMSRTKVVAPVEEFRDAVLGQSQESSDAIERAADTIAVQSTVPLVRVNALEWKLVSSTELQSAALARDPAVALADLILFTLQMQAFLTTGQGKDLFGPQQPIAVGVMNRSLTRLLGLVDQVSSDTGSSGRWLRVLEPMAAGNPIRSPYVGRVGVTDTVAQLLAVDRGALAAVGDIETTARLLDRRIEQIQRSLLKQARWQVELILADAAKQPVVDSLVRDVGRLTTSVETITGVTEGLPGLVTGERIAALQAITNERIAVLEAITAERMALLEGVTAERVAVVNALHEERIATLHDAELSAQRLIDYTLNQRIELIINHVLWRVFLGLVLLILLAFGAGLVLVTFARRSGRLVRT
jgi:hypothetical protein